MKTSQIIVGTFIVLFYALLPQVSLGYFTTNQHASKFNETSALFVIEYEFGHRNTDFYMPVLTERGLLWEGTEEKVGYTLREDGKDITENGTTTGLVLSSAPIVNGMYKLEKGKTQKLYLVVLLTTPQGEPETDYALQVERLPFYVDTGKKKLETRELNPSELQYYVTKQVELNSGN